MSASTKAGADEPGNPSVRRLSPEDLSILALENETVAGHTCKLICLEERIDPDGLRASIAGRLDRAPELCLRLGDLDGTLCWESAGTVDLSAQVIGSRSAAPLDEAGLRATVADLFEQRLDRSRPLWRIDVIPELAGGGTAVIWRIHHALADGATAMRIANAVLWDDEPTAQASPCRSPRRPPAPSHPAAASTGPAAVVLVSERSA